MSFMDGRRTEPGPSRVRPHGNLMALRAAVIVLFAILGGRLAYMQIVKGEEYSERSRNNHIQSQQILPARGLIYDSAGRPLVDNVGTYSLTVVPELLPSSTDERRTLYLFLEQATGVPALEIQARVAQAEAEGLENQALAIRRNLPKEDALKLTEVVPDMAGVFLNIEPGRWYTGGDTYSSMLGYIGPITAEEWAVLRDEGYQFNQPVGKTGIEQQYESELRGRVGWSSNEVDAFGNIVQVLDTEPPVPGNSLHLSINADLQDYVAEVLTNNMGEARKAAAVVMDANTGAVLSMVSVPGWDNNIFSDPVERADEYQALLEDPRKPLLNQAVNLASPGSTFKLLTAAAALQEGNITPATGRDIPSMLKEFEGENGEIQQYWDWAAHGYVNLASAIARSSNLYFFQSSCGFFDEGIEGIGRDVEDSAYRLRYYAQRFGFGRPTGIDTGDEAIGIIPDPEWKRQSRSDTTVFNPEDAEWYHADTCFMSVGQGDVTATPLQVARMTAAIANGGSLVVPRLVWEVTDANGETVKTFDPEWETVPVEPQHLASIREGMELSVNASWGAAHQAFRPGVSLAGKTGTSEYLDQGVRREYAWFTGYYPMENPQVVITVYFDIGTGGGKAAPVAGQIMEYYNRVIVQ